MIRFACPNCGDAYQVEDNQGGQTAQCAKCATQFVIPISNAPAPPELPRSPVNQEFASPSNPTQIEVKPCPVCGSRAQVDRSDIGQKVECPACLSTYIAEPVHPLPKREQLAKSTPSQRKRQKWDDERRDEEDEEDEDDRPRRRRRRKSRKRPSNVSAVAALLLAGGIYGIFYALIMGISTFFACFWPGLWFAVVWSIIAIVRGSTMLNENDTSPAPRVMAILQIVMIVNCDIVNMVMGIVNLVLLNDDKMVEYYEWLEERRED
jgi:predicted RNA-binding Zn-ribbon protein involved in translation (DUF1610 family)